ncbi:hypothetical protein CANCADRAFT_31772 [Tortispora caseinolytica NRRL Y-17796]|uniref:Uncharacterized protein n=1 Tax=Tortispora caseinolytica NRRL Y-17796 TaxID=767744 RepID=A0A1E4TGS7_9ASCO|nr:hypothetical protein CANCADRAFT_31772 [Tortispora caseinolytica NRRL Y-17796]
MGSFSEILTSTIHAFMSGGDVDSPYFNDLYQKHRSDSAKVKESLSEAHFELLFAGKEEEYQHLLRISNSYKELVFNLNALTSCARTQWSLFIQHSQMPLQHRMSIMSIDNNPLSPTDISNRLQREVTEPPKSPVPNITVQAQTPMHSHSDSNVPPGGYGSIFTPSHARSSSMFQNVVHGESFLNFVYHLGPPIRNISDIMSNILADMPFDAAPEFYLRDTSRYSASLKTCLDQYSAIRVQSIASLYTSDTSGSKTPDIAADQEEIAASCGSFAYSLENLASELLTFLSVMEDYRGYLNQRRPRTWQWAKFWRSLNVDSASRTLSSMAHFFHRNDGVYDLAADGAVRMSFHNNAYDSTRHSRFGFVVWKGLRYFRHNDVKFGLKVGLGAIILGAPAVIPSTREVYQHWHLEWAVVTYSIMMNMSIGGTALTALPRAIGTTIGAVAAMAAWFLFPENPYALAIAGWLLSLPCFYIVLTWKDVPAFGRFVLLTFNLSCLYSYTLGKGGVIGEPGEIDGPIITEIAIHRCLSVVIGILWGIVITIYVMPLSARASLKNGLSKLWILLGLRWRADPLNSLARGDQVPKQYISANSESNLQNMVTLLESYLKFAPKEPRLKGPFPTDSYRKLLAWTRQIIDSYSSISVDISREPIASRLEAELLDRTLEERRELSSRIFLHFYVLGSALSMAMPLPERLPSVSHARDRLLMKINAFRDEQRSKGHLSEDGFVLFYMYSLVTMTIHDCILKMTQEVQYLFGIIDEEEFFI